MVLRVHNYDLTGVIGVMQKENSYWEHAFTSLNRDASFISDSSGSVGVSNRVTPKRWTQRDYSRVRGYLRIKLKNQY